VLLDGQRRIEGYKADSEDFHVVPDGRDSNFLHDFPHAIGDVLQNRVAFGPETDKVGIRVDLGVHQLDHDDQTLPKPQLAPMFLSIRHGSFLHQILVKVEFNQLSKDLLHAFIKINHLIQGLPLLSEVLAYTNHSL
jgi:hypothetical protein